jgi:hypothetical protein
VATLGRWDGGADGEVGRDVVARWEGEGRARRGRREGPDGGGRDQMGKGGGQTGCQTGGGGCVCVRVPNRMEGSVGRGFVEAGRDKRMSEREGCRGRQERVSEQRGRVKLAAWIMCACGMLGPLVLHLVLHHWSRLC